MTADDLAAEHARILREVEAELLRLPHGDFVSLARLRAILRATG